MHTEPTARPGAANPLGPCLYVTREQIAEHVNATASQMSRVTGTVGFPPPALHLGAKSPRWLLADILAWAAAGGVNLALAKLDELDEAAAAVLEAGSAQRAEVEAAGGVMGRPRTSDVYVPNDGYSRIASSSPPQTMPLTRPTSGPPGPASPS